MPWSPSLAILLALGCCLWGSAQLALSAPVSEQIASKGIASQDGKAAIAAHKTEAKNKNKHPVVIFPSPILDEPQAKPKTSTSLPPANKPAPISDIVVKVEQTPTDSSAVIKPPVRQATITSPPKTTPATHNGDHQAQINPIPKVSAAEHPAVYNEAVPSKNQNQSQTRLRAHGQGWEPGFYPAGYQPPSPPTTTAQAQRLKKALVHYNRGVYYTQQQMWDEGTNEYQKVLSTNPASADAYVGLSTIALYERNWESALKNALLALQMKQSFFEPANITQARYNISSVYCVSNDYKEALRYYKQVRKAKHPEADTLWAFLQRNCRPSTLQN